MKLFRLKLTSIQTLVCHDTYTLLNSLKLINSAWFLLFISAFLSLGYFFADGGARPIIFYATFVSQFIVLALMWSGIEKKWFNPTLTQILFFSLLARALIVFSDPIFEIDYFRYLWDGRVLAHGVNPYLYLPEAPELDFLDTTFRHKIGWKEYKTLYPPFSELVFAFSHILAPDSLIGLKLILTLFEIATGVILIFLMRDLKINPTWSVLYFLNPLVFKEVTNSAHLDSIVVFFTTLSIYWFQKPKYQLLSWAALATAVASKLYPLIFLPIYFSAASGQENKKWHGIAVFLMVLLALYLPFYQAGWNLFLGDGAFARYWRFNAGLFQLFSLFFNLFFSASVVESDFFFEDYPSKIFFGLILLGFVFAVAQNVKKYPNHFIKGCFIVLGAALMVSPVVDAWYLLWILPFAVLYRSIAWIGFMGLALITCYFYKWWEPGYYIFRFIEYGFLFGLFSWQAIAKKSPKYFIGGE